MPDEETEAEPHRLRGATPRVRTCPRPIIAWIPPLVAHLECLEQPDVFQKFSSLIRLSNGVFAKDFTKGTEGGFCSGAFSSLAIRNGSYVYLTPVSPFKPPS